MGILCITLKEKIQNGLCRIGMLFFIICNFFFVYYSVGLLQYSKSVWSKVGTPTV